jgi:hypothetical protein
MKTKHVAILFVLSAAAGAPIVAEAQSANTPTLPARTPQATGPPRTDGAPAQDQVRPPVDAGSDCGIQSSGSASGSSVRDSACQCKRSDPWAISPCLSLTERDTREAMWSMLTFPNSRWALAIAAIGGDGRRSTRQINGRARRRVSRVTGSKTGRRHSKWQNG